MQGPALCGGEVWFLGPLEARVALHGMGLEGVIQLFLPGKKMVGLPGKINLCFGIPRAASPLPW